MGLSSWSLDHIAFSWRVIPKAFRIKDPWESWNYQIIDLHDLLVVPVTIAHHHHHLLIALLTPMGARHHASFDDVNHQRAFRPIAYINAPPGLLVKRLTPRRHALPGTIGPPPLAAILGWRGLEITHQRVRRHREHVPL